MKFVVLGSGTGLSDPERGPAGFVVAMGDRQWLIDGGSGTLQRCARAGFRPESLTGGIYSHRHPDHCADLVPLLFAMRIDGREAPYPIWAAEGFADYVTALQGIYGRWMTPSGGLTVHEVAADEVRRVKLDPELTLVTAPANHSAGALHLRFESPRGTVVFSGDTGPSDQLTALARGADLLVCECGGSDEDPLPGHLHPAAFASLARDAQPKQIWLTHFYPAVDAAHAVATVAATGVATRRAADGDTWVP